MGPGMHLMRGMLQQFKFLQMWEGKQDSSFGSWFLEAYPDGKEAVLKRGTQDGNFPAKISMGQWERLCVAYDRYRDIWIMLKGTGPGIYLRGRRSRKSCRVVIAGDLCFAEDGFVLDHYDTVDGLPECISPAAWKYPMPPMFFI